MQVKESVHTVKEKDKQEHRVCAGSCLNAGSVENPKQVGSSIPGCKEGGCQNSCNIGHSLGWGMGMGAEPEGKGGVLGGGEGTPFPDPLSIFLDPIK